MQTGRKAVKQSVGTPGSSESIQSTRKGGILSMIRKISRVINVPIIRRLSISLALFSKYFFNISNSDHGRRDNWTVNPAFDILIHEIA